MKMMNRNVFVGKRYLGKMEIEVRSRWKVIGMYDAIPIFQHIRIQNLIKKK